MTKVRRRDAAENRERILAAAKALALQSSASATLADVAAMAGVAPATLYRAFASRRALVAALHAREMCDELAPAVANVETATDVLSALRQLSGEMVTVAAARHDVLAESPEVIPAYIERYMALYGHVLGDVMARAQAQGLLRADLTTEDIDGIARFFVGGLSQPGLSASQRSRYLNLWFDAVSGEPLRRSP